MPTGHKKVREPVEDRDIGARPVRQVHVGAGSELSATRIDDD
jgi:hypothetical protein